MTAKDMIALGNARSVIFEMFEYGSRRAQIIGPENVLDFSIGNPNVPAPPEVQDAIREIMDTLPPVAYHGYTPSLGTPAARKAVADDLNVRYGTNYTADHFFLTCGGAASLNIVFKALIDEKTDEILIFAPYFPEYPVYIEAQGGVTVVVPPGEEMYLNTDALRRTIGKNTRAIVINSPNNPAGVIYPRENLEEVARILKEKSEEYGHPIYIITDEPYRELVYTDAEDIHIPQLYDNTVVCYAWSKSLSLAGERIGYILLPDSIENQKDLLAACRGAARALGFVCAPSLFQKVIERCVSVRPDFSMYRKNRDLLFRGLREIGYRMAEPAGAFYLFAEAPGGDAKAFCERAKAYDLLMAPGDTFGVPTHMRISYCVETEKIEKALPVFARLMEETKEE